MANKKIGGPVFAKIDGTLVYSKGDVTYNHGGYKAEDVVGSDQTHGYTEKPQPAMVKLTISVTSDTDVAKLKASRNATISLPLPSGKTFTLPNAWCISESEVNATSGEVELEFHGSVGIEA